MAPVVARLATTRSPIEALSRFADLPGACLLQSAAAKHPLSRYSYLAADPVTTISANASDWPAVRDQIRATFASHAETVTDLPPFQGGWIGWFGYELGTAFDTVARHRYAPAIPDVALGLYDWVIAWDHARGDAWLISSGIDASGMRHTDRAFTRAEAVQARWRTNGHLDDTGARATIDNIHADFTPDAYETAVGRVIEYVLAGDVFQANLAQRFTIPFYGSPLELYRNLTDRSPAPMAAFIQRGEVSVISASPEQFIQLDAATRRVETRPIKGTRPRDADATRDAARARELERSEKDRAENVMIVDLLRNDLSRVCQPGTVRTPALCVLESHPTVHHLVSTVIGDLEPGRDALDLLAATFPGGSITGAPKLRAMEIIQELEPIGRGVYSGAIGWIGLDGAMNTSIAIRTVTLASGIASLHAGGGITARSSPPEEYQETLDKARALLDTLSAMA